MKKQTIAYPCRLDKRTLWKRIYRDNLFCREWFASHRQVLHPLNWNNINHLELHFVQGDGLRELEYIRAHMYRYAVDYLFFYDELAHRITLEEKTCALYRFERINSRVAPILMGLLSLVVIIVPSIPWPVPALLLSLTALLAGLSLRLFRFRRKKVREMLDAYMAHLLE